MGMGIGKPTEKNPLRTELFKVRQIAANIAVDWSILFIRYPILTNISYLQKNTSLRMYVF